MVRHLITTWMVLGLTCTVQAQDRLQIAFVPVYVIPAGAFSAGTFGQDEVRALAPESSDADVAMRAIHEAMSMLNLQSSQYDLMRAYGSDNQSRVLECSLATSTAPSECGLLHNTNQIYPIGQEEMKELWKPLGFDSSDPDELQPGSILALILLKSDGFPWGGYAGGGSSTFLVWTDVDPEVMHWSTSACAFWSHLYLPAIAHELGHCFGLFHNGAGDINFDGLDDTLDLMVSPQTPVHSSRLKSSNQARIDHHFRDLSENEEAQSLGAPLIVR